MVEATNTERVHKLSMPPFLCPKVFFFCFFALFFAYFLDPCRETFLCPKVFFSFCFFLVFLFRFYWTPAVKMKKQSYLCLYPLVHLHKIKFFEKIAAYNSWPLIEETGSVKTKLRTHNTFVLTPSRRTSKACWESCRAVPFVMGLPRVTILPLC